MDMMLLLFTIVIIVGLYYGKQKLDQKKTSAPQAKKEEIKPIEKVKAKTKEVIPTESSVSNKDLKRQELELKKNLKKIKKTNPTHSSFLRGFKGFKEKIEDFDVSADGLYLVACSRDCTFRVFKSKDIKDQEPLVVYQKIDFHEPSSISLSQDKKLIAIGMSDSEVVELFSVEEFVSTDGDEDKAKLNIRQYNRSADKLHKTTIRHLFLDYSGKFYITGSDEEDTTVKVWGLNGESLNKFDTAQLKNHHIIRSQNGHFLAVGAWTADVILLEVKANKDGSFKSLSKAMVLKGHRQGIIDLSFNNLDNRIVTLSKDHTIKVWDIDVRYEMSEDPKCLTTINTHDFEEFKNLNGPVRIGMCTFEESSKSLIVIAHNNNLIIFNLEEGKVVETIHNLHSEGSQINKMMFKTHKSVPYLYSSGDDGRVNMWDLSKL